MPSVAPEPQPTTAFPPTTPVCARSNSTMPPPPARTPPHTASRSPFAQRSPHKPLWPQESVAHSQSIPAFPLDPALGGTDVYSIDDRGVDIRSAESGFMPMSTSASPMSFVPAQYHDNSPPPIHLLSQYGGPNGMRMDPRMMQRTHSDAAPTYRAPGSQFLYYHQVPGSDQQPIAWSTREVALRSPPAPRQRSAKACKKCRKRKTKVCFFVPPSPFFHLSASSTVLRWSPLCAMRR